MAITRASMSANAKMEALDDIPYQVLAELPMRNSAARKGDLPMVAFLYSVDNSCRDRHRKNLGYEDILEVLGR